VRTTRFPTSSSWYFVATIRSGASRTVLDPPDESREHVMLGIELATGVVSGTERTRIIRCAKCVGPRPSSAMLHTGRHKQTIEVSVLATEIFFDRFVAASHTLTFDRQGNYLLNIGPPSP
jgi:hypothetical protein